MKTKNQSSLPSKYWLIIVIVICVILMGVERITGGNGPISFVANYTVIPMQKGIGYVGRYMSDLSDNFETLQDMKKENRKLQSKVDDLTIDNTRLRQDQYELERLRELYKLDENYSDYKKVGAHVISNNGSNWFSDFTIDKGKKDGIKKNCNVLAGSGLVGIVTEVGPHYARVRSIIDDESNISAMLLSTSDTCVVRGDLKQMENGRIRFEKLANNDNKIEVGEQVVTSHVSDRFLQGLFVGYVSEVKVDSNNLTRSGYITPAVDFTKLQEVLVITTTKNDQTRIRRYKGRVIHETKVDYILYYHYMLFNGMHHLPPIVFCIHQTEPADYHHFIVRIYAWKERGSCRRIPFRLFDGCILVEYTWILYVTFLGDRISERIIPKTFL